MKKQIGWNALKLTMVKTITLMMSMLLTMLLSRYRSLEEYGTYSQLLLITSITMSLFLLGLPNSINYFLTDKDERNKFLSKYFSLTIIGCITLGGILVIAIPLFVKYFANPTLNRYGFFLCIYPLANMITTSFENICIVLDRLKLLMFYKLIHSVIQLLLVMVSVLCFVPFRVYVIALILLESMYALLILLTVYLKMEHLSFIFNYKDFLSIIKYSLPLGLSSMVGTLSIECDKMMIGFLYDTSVLAVYTNTARELPFNIIPVSISAILLPAMIMWVKNNEQEKALFKWNSSITLSFTVMAYVSLMVFSFAKEIIIVLYSEKYLEGETIMKIYSLIYICRCTYFSQFFNAKGKTRYVLYMSLFNLLLNVCFNFIFSCFFGINGPALGTVTSIFVTCFIYIYFYQKILKVSWRKIINSKELLLVTAMNLIGGVLLEWIGQKVDFGQSQTGMNYVKITAGFIWSGIYFVLFFRMLKTKWKILNSD